MHTDYTKRSIHLRQFTLPVEKKKRKKKAEWKDLISCERMI